LNLNSSIRKRRNEA